MKPNYERLEQLAAHLLSNNLGHLRFDFSVISEVGLNYCRTAGCAIGEFPFVWPESWEFLPRMHDDIIGRIRFGIATTDSRADPDQFWQPIAEWLGITENITHTLFIPKDAGDLRDHFYKKYPWYRLTDELATAAEVARNILRFCDYCRSRETPEPEPEPEPIPVAIPELVAVS